MRVLRHAPFLVLPLASALAASPALADPASTPPRPAASAAPSVAVGPPSSPAPLAPTSERAHVPPGTTEGKLPAQDPPKPAMVMSGILVTVVGVGLTAGGAALVAESKIGPGYESDDNPWAGIGGSVGGVMLAFGVVHLVVGVPLIVVGEGVGSSSKRDPKSAPVYARALPEVTAGPRSVKMRWVF